jgi:hypothetical protein
VAGYLKLQQELHGTIIDPVDVSEHCSPEEENIWSMNVIPVIYTLKVYQTGKGNA